MFLVIILRATHLAARVQTLRIGNRNFYPKASIVTHPVGPIPTNRVIWDMQRLSNIWLLGRGRELRAGDGRVGEMIQLVRLSETYIHLYK
ncbi:hypothetical protein BJX99DRAFT_236843 [Aspergillus californicus]